MLGKMAEVKELNSSKTKLPRRRSASSALRSLKEKLVIQRRISEQIQAKSGKEEPSRRKVVDYSEVDARLRNAHSVLLSRIRVQSAQLNGERQDASVNIPVDSSSQRCLLIDVTISEVRLNLMWSAKQHFDEMQNPNVNDHQQSQNHNQNQNQNRNRKFAVVCVAIAVANGAGQALRSPIQSRSQSQPRPTTPRQSSSPQSGVNSSVQSATNRHFDAPFNDWRASPKRVRILSTELVRDVDWSATDIVFKAPMRFAFCRNLNRLNANVTDAPRSLPPTARPPRERRTTSIVAEVNEAESIRLEFYATPYCECDSDNIQFDEFDCNGFRISVDAESKSKLSAGPQFRLIAAADLQLADLERQFVKTSTSNHNHNHNQSRPSAGAAGRGASTSVTVASVLERTPISAELGHDENWSKKKCLSTPLSAAVRRIKSIRLVTLPSDTAGSNKPDSLAVTLPFRIPLFGAFTFALRINLYDLVATFV